MCTALDELLDAEGKKKYEQGMEAGMEQGMEKGRELIILGSLKKNKSCKDIAEFNDLDLQFVMKVAKENGFPTE